MGLGLRHQETDADLFIEDENGVVIDSSERSATANEWLRETLLAGSYRVRIEAQEAGVSEYVFRYGVREADPDEVARLEGEREEISGDDADLPNDTTTTGRVEVGGSVTGTIEIPYDQDRFAVEFEGGRTYRFDLRGSPGGGGTLPDTYFRAIYNSEGRYQSGSYNDNFGGSRDSRVTFAPTESGTYYARVSGDRDETGSYTLSVTDVTPQETEFEGAPGHATPGGSGTKANVSEGGTDLPASTATTGEVDVGDSVMGTIGDHGDDDWFKVELKADTKYQIDLEGVDTGRGTVGDPLLGAIREADGDKVSGTPDGYSQDNGENKNARGFFTPEADGTYYLVVRYNIGAGTADRLGTYTLSVTVKEFTEGATDLPTDTTTTGVVEVDGFGARGTIAPPVAILHTATNAQGSTVESTSYGFDTDWFAVELEAGRTYRIDMKGAILTGPGTYADDELTLRLPQINAIYDADGGFLFNTWSRDESSSHHLFRVTFTPNAGGTYYIAASGESFEAGGYELRIIDITASADEHTADRRTTGTVMVGNSARGKIDFSGDVDWFKVENLSPGDYQVDLEGQATGRGSLRDPYLKGIFDADGNEISGTRNDDGGEGYNARVTFEAKKRANYYIAVGAFGYLEGTYTLSLLEDTS